MKRRYEAAVAYLSTVGLGVLKVQPAIALRRALRKGYGGRELGRDLMAGLVVGVVALPLAMALAIASGVPPQHGLYTAIIAGAVIALLGGSKVQVSGPTAAFVVILAPISARFGIGGLLVATLLAGIILVIMGAARLGRLIEFIPHPVTTGFTAGIAVVIATIQLKDFFGLTVAGTPEHYLDRVAALWHAAPTLHLPDFAVGAATLVLLLLWPRITTRVPAPLVALTAVTVGTFLLQRFVPAFHVDTLGSRFSYVVDGVTRPGIPPLPPLPVLPWSLPGPDGQPLVLSWALIRELMPSAFAIAILGAIESLLCAVVADAMIGTQHDPDSELLAQGVGNIVAPFFGGIAATGAIARTATNIRSGGRSPIAAIFHAVVVLLGMVVLAPLLAHLPMASLAALLLLVAWNMSEVKHFAHIVRVAPRSDVVVLLACFSLTVIFDMVVSVTAGVLLAALLFMRRMAEISSSRLVGEMHQLSRKLPQGVMLYDIGGPLFFGAAQKAMTALARAIGDKPKVMILDLEDVPAMDVTGLVALETSVDRLRKVGAQVILAGVQEQPRAVIARSALGQQVRMCFTLEEAAMASYELLGETPPPREGAATPLPPAAFAG